MMKLFAKKGSDNKDNSLNLFHGEAAAASAESAGCSFQSNSLIAVGADASTVSLLNTITNLVLAGLLIKVPNLVEGKTPMKRTVVMMAVINAFTWIPIVFVFTFFRTINPLMLIGLWILGLVPATLLGPLRDNWLANMVPSEKMGRYLSWRAVIAGIFYLAALNIMGLALNQSHGNVGRGFAVVLAVAFLASVVSTFLYSMIHSPPPVARSQTAPSLTFKKFLQGARKEHLGTFILFVSLFTFTVQLSGPLQAVYMQRDLKFSFMQITLIASCEFIARVISITFWGKMVDKSGSLRVLGIVSHLIPLSPLLWMLSKGNVAFLCGAQLFSGTVWAAFDLSNQTFIYKSTQPEQRLHYIVYCKSLTTFASALGMMAGGLLLNHMFRISGSQILAMFLVSSVARLAVVRMMLPKLKPGGIPDAIVHEELARELAMVNYPTRQGLYYHPEAWSRFAKPVAAFGTILGKAVNKINPKPAGLYYNPQQWSNFMGQNSDLQPGMVQYGNTESVKRGLYHNKKAWSEYRQQTAIQVEADGEQVKEGLLYNPEAWPAMVPEMKVEEDAKPVRKGLLNDPEAIAAVTAAAQTAQDEAKRQDNLKPVRKGLLYDHEAWARMVNQMAQVNVKFSDSLKPVRKGLLNDPEAMARFMHQTETAEARAISAVKVNRTGIFYDSEKWSDYLKRSMGLNATTMRTGGDIQTNRQPIFYHPEAWNNYKSHTAIVKTTSEKAAVPARQALLYHPEEWERTFDPQMVHIGRKSAIGTIINRQSPIKKTDRRAPPAAHPVSRPVVMNNRFGTRPSLA
jgi:MFS family permease